MEFEKLTKEEKKLYSKIENLIIIWNNDGTKTAGSLTREIMDILKLKKRGVYGYEDLFESFIAGDTEGMRNGGDIDRMEFEEWFNKKYKSF